MARPSGMASWRLRFVIADEGPTCMAGGLRNQPQRWVYRKAGLLFTLSHTGLVIGIMEDIYDGRPGEVPGTEGHCLIGVARLYNSLLAGAAWRGIERGIFHSVCAVVLLPDPSEPGKGELLEIALADRPGIKNARILDRW